MHFEPYAKVHAQRLLAGICRKVISQEIFSRLRLFNNELLFLHLRFKQENTREHNL